MATPTPNEQNTSKSNLQTPHSPIFAVFHGDREITQAMYKEVLDFVAYIKAKQYKK